MTTRTQSILILDDETSVRESLAGWFEDREWAVTTATTAEEALDYLTRRRFDGALVDLRLPGMSGTEFIHRAHGQRPQLAFVIVTGSPSFRRSPEVAACDHVADELFSKPVFDLSALEQALCRQIERCRGRS